MNYEDWRMERTRIISEMLDNLINTVFTTTRCFVELDKLFEITRSQISEPQSQATNKLKAEIAECVIKLESFAGNGLADDYAEDMKLVQNIIKKLRQLSAV